MLMEPEPEVDMLFIKDDGAEGMNDGAFPELIMNDLM